MSESRSDELTRKISELLASLVLESDAGLEAFRARHGLDPALDLVKARAAVQAIGGALLSSNRESLEAAWEVLRRAPPTGSVSIGRPKISTLESRAVPPMPLSGAGASPATLPTGQTPWPVVISPSPVAAPLSRDPQSITLGEGKAPPSALDDGPRRPLVDLNSTAESVLVLDSAPLPLGKPALTIEQYASLQAELRGAPSVQHSLIAARYGVNTSEAQSSLDDHWRERFAADAALQSRFGELVSRYVTWLASSKPR